MKGEEVSSGWKHPHIPTFLLEAAAESSWSVNSPTLWRLFRVLTRPCRLRVSDQTIDSRNLCRKPSDRRPSPEARHRKRLSIALKSWSTFTSEGTKRAQSQTTSVHTCYIIILSHYHHETHSRSTNISRPLVCQHIIEFRSKGEENISSFAFCLLETKTPSQPHSWRNFRVLR